MNFKSNISTTREQSRRLLGLGVKPETADMYYWYEGNPYYCPYSLKVQDKVMPYELREEDVPSWSLSRLLEMMPDRAGELTLKVLPPMVGYLSSDIGRFYDEDDVFDNCVNMIEWLIGECYFNQDYLIHSNSSKTGKEEVQP